MYLVYATPLTVVSGSFLNFAGMFYMVGGPKDGLRMCIGLDIKLRLIFAISFFTPWI